MIYQFLQNFINQYLERNRSVDKLERYNCILEIIITNTERRHLLVVLTYFNPIICIFKIEFDKVHNAHKTI